MREAWTQHEIDLVVSDYISMLDMEMRGQKFVKAQHNRRLQDLTGRSKGSIEYKHQNISAVIESFGLPYIRGYVPARNFQRALYEAVAERLDSQDGELVRIAETPLATDVVPETGVIYQTPPPLLDPSRVQSKDNVVRDLIRKFDPALRDARARALGEAGEQYLYQAEQNRLSAAGRDDLARMVRWVSKEDGDGAGYDILSYSRCGHERWLEVKTTNGSERTPFWISENERRVSEEKPEVFRLARLYDFSRQPTAFRLRPPLTDHVELAPTNYRATFL